MSAILAITRAGPLLTVQDAGRFGHLADGISASGPMDAMAYQLAGALARSQRTVQRGKNCRRAGRYVDRRLGAAPLRPDQGMKTAPISSP